MKQFFSCLFIPAFFVFAATKAKSQGCVAVRSTGAACLLQHNDDSTAGKSWQFTTAFRYFKSYRHFRGKHEEKDRVEENTEVINRQTSFDLSLIRNFNSRWSLAINIPILVNVRSSKYEHYGNNSTDPGARRSTYSYGLGDIKLVGYYWLLNPVKHMKGNIQAGFGIKFPTGDYKVLDHFYRNDSTAMLGPVDQSIQLGDGGTGFTTELNAFYNFSKVIGIYTNLFYLLNPREHNGVSTARGGATSQANTASGNDVMSVPDQYMVRIGADINVNRFSIYAGGRMECIPVYDLIGGSNGFRRPGYIISAEPGIAYRFKRISLFTSVPVAIERNRTQSVPDKKRTEQTGIFTQGDAAFADYLINAGLSIRF